MNRRLEGNFYEATTEIIDRLGLPVVNAIAEGENITEACKKEKVNEAVIWGILGKYGLTKTKYQRLLQKVGREEEGDFEEIEDSSLAERKTPLLTTITKDIKSKFPKKSGRKSLVNLLKRENLSPDEGCIMAGYDPEDVSIFLRRYHMSLGDYQTRLVEDGTKKVKLKPRKDRASPIKRGPREIRAHVKHPDDFDSSLF